METNFNFKSQICTSREQSERLLALGLKKETADMTIHDEFGISTIFGVDYSTYVQLHKEQGYTELFFEKTHPAWSLHRLIILCGNIACDWIFRNDDCYTNAINCIEWLIKEGYFNKEYLENGNC